MRSKLLVIVNAMPAGGMAWRTALPARQLKAVADLIICAPRRPWRVAQVSCVWHDPSMAAARAGAPSAWRLADPPALGFHPPDQGRGASWTSVDVNCCC